MFHAALISLPALSLILAANAAGCDISGVKMNFPPGQTALADPTTKPSFVAVAIGTQNYTCDSTGHFANNTAVAEVFDISCLYNSPAFESIQDIAYSIWNLVPPAVTPQLIMNLLHNSNRAEILGQHYYVPNPVTGVGLNPIWDFRFQGANTGNKDAYVVAARVSGMAAPTGVTDIDWVSLRSLAGGLAQEVYRTDTRGGKAPASCTPGSIVSVKYASKYWLFGGSVKQ